MTNQTGLIDAPFIFTEIDTSLTGSSDRDVLGLEPFNRHYGKQITHYLTSRSNSAVHLSASLLFAHLHEEITRNHGINWHRRDFVLVMEQIFSFACLRQNADGVFLPGINRLKHRWQEKEDSSLVGRGGKYQLLNNQFGQGIFGRNNTPLYRMGLLSREDWVDWPKGWDARKIWGPEVDLLPEVLGMFTAPMKGPSSGPRALNEIGGYGWPALAETICRLTGAMPEGFKQSQIDFWKEQLKLNSDGLLKELRAAYLKQAGKEKKHLGAKESIEQLINNPEVSYDSRLREVRACEQFLGPLEGYFNLMRALPGLDKVREFIADTKNGKPGFYEEMRERQKRFNELKSLTGRAAQRRKHLAEISITPDNLGKSLLSYHQHPDVSPRGPILSLSQGDKLDTTRPDRRKSKATARNLLQQWRRDYYLSSLEGIVKELWKGGGA